MCVENNQAEYVIHRSTVNASIRRYEKVIEGTWNQYGTSFYDKIRFPLYCYAALLGPRLQIKIYLEIWWNLKRKLRERESEWGIVMDIKGKLTWGLMGGTAKSLKKCKVIVVFPCIAKYTLLRVVVPYFWIHARMTRSIMNEIYLFLFAKFINEF